MYPYPLIFVGSAQGLHDLDRAIVANAAKLVGRCTDLKGFRALLKTSDSSAHAILVRMRDEEDIGLLHQIGDAYPGYPAIALVEGECDSRTLARISRAGAAQIVLIPWSENDLDDALSRITMQFGKAPAVARVLAVCGVSEGAGATCIALNVAHELAERWRQQCILAEPMVPFGRLASYLDCRSPKSSEELFAGSEAPDLPALQKALTPVSDGLKLLVSPRASPPSVPPAAGRILAIAEGLRRLSQAIVFDMPYTFDEASFDLLSQADDVLLVCVPSIPSLQALEVIRDALRRRRMCGEQRVVLNCYANSSDEFKVSRLQQALHVDQIWTIANDTAGFRKAINGGGLLRNCAPHSHALGDIDRLLTAMFGPAASSKSDSSFFRRLVGRKSD